MIVNDIALLISKNNFLKKSPDNLIDRITKRMEHPLPGRDAHMKLAHVTRRLYTDAPTGARKAGVLAALFPEKDDWNIIFIVRNTSDRDRHGGQLGFPGGKYEEGDGNLQQTALREAMEEIGLPPEQVNLLGSLTDIYIPVSNFAVHPFLGWVAQRPDYKLQLEEVSGILEVPLSDFQKKDVLQTTDIRVSEHLVLKNVPYYNVQGKILWGATAMMMSEVLEVVHG